MSCHHVPCLLSLSHILMQAAPAPAPIVEEPAAEPVVEAPAAAEPAPVEEVAPAAEPVKET